MGRVQIRVASNSISQLVCVQAASCPTRLSLPDFSFNDLARPGAKAGTEEHCATDRGEAAYKSERG